LFQIRSTLFQDDGTYPDMSFFEKTYFRFLRRGQKLAGFIENKVVQNLKLEKLFVYKKGLLNQ